MPHLSSHGLHLLLILTKYLLIKLQLFLKVPAPLDPDNTVISLDFRMATIWVFVTVLQHISPFITIHLRQHEVLLTTVYAESSPWSNQQRGQLCYRTSQHCRCILHSTATRYKIDLFRSSHPWLLSLHSHIVIIWFSQYPKNTSDICECKYAWFLKLPLPTTPITSAAFIAGALSIEWYCLTHCP